MTKIVVDAGAGEAAQEVEIAAFPAALRSSRSVTCLQRVVDRRAGPGRLNHHGLDDEGRILAAAEPDNRRATPASTAMIIEVDDERAVLERPLGQVETASWLRSEQANLLPRMQRLHAGRHDDLAGVETASDRHVAWSKRRTSTLRIETVLFAGSTIQTAGCWLSLVSAVAGISNDRQLRRSPRGR